VYTYAEVAGSDTCNATCTVRSGGSVSCQYFDTAEGYFLFSLNSVPTTYQGGSLQVWWTPPADTGKTSWTDLDCTYNRKHTRVFPTHDEYGLTDYGSPCSVAFLIDTNDAPYCCFCGLGVFEAPETCFEGDPNCGSGTYICCVLLKG
jgi:hypothetical protein